MNGEREWATDGRKAERKTAFKMEAERETSGMGIGGWARGWRRNRQEGEGRRWHWTECIEQGERYGTNDRMRAPRYALALLAPTTDARLVSSSFPVTFSSRIRWRQNACRALPTGCWQYPRERDLILCLFLHRQGFFFFFPLKRSRDALLLLIRSFDVN